MLFTFGFVFLAGSCCDLVVQVRNEALDKLSNEKEDAQKEITTMRAELEQVY